MLAHGLRVQCWRRCDSKNDPRCSSRSMEQQATLCSVRKQNMIIQSRTSAQRMLPLPCIQHASPHFLKFSSNTLIVTPKAAPPR